MKAQPQPKKRIEARKLRVQEIEQTATTSIASEQAWILLALIMVVALMGLYWLNDKQGDQPDWSYEAVNKDLSTSGKLAEAVNVDQTATGLENQTKALPEDFTSSTMSISSQNEQLVRRYYDEVINHRQIAVLDNLLAEHAEHSMAERQGSMTTVSLKALKQQVISESTAYAGLQYSIEEMVVGGNWVLVDWSAKGRPLVTWLAEGGPLGSLTEVMPVQVWSGRTMFGQIEDGKIVRMWTYNTTEPQPYQTSENKAGLSNPLQDSQDLARYQLHLNGDSPIR